MSDTTLWRDITYSEFWDVPRVFTVRNNSNIYLFDCRFDDGLDDYPDFFKVYLLDEKTSADEYLKNKMELRSPCLGTVRVKDVKFDPTLRKQIKIDVLEGLTKEP